MRKFGFLMLLTLGACSVVPPPNGETLLGVPKQPADPTVVARIVKVCTNSGWFKLADGALSIAVPAAALPVSVINAGVDKVCAAPENYASDLSTVEWLVKNL